MHRRHRRDEDAEKERSLVLGKVEALGVSDGKQPWNGHSGVCSHLWGGGQRWLCVVSPSQEPKL